MNSSIIGYFPEHELFARSASTILSFAAENDHYDEFKVGDWKTFVFRNASGNDADGFVSGSADCTKPTSRGKQLPELNDWIERTFRLDLLRLARVHSLGDGVLIPHRDFVEFGNDKSAWTRVHIPILTNSRCFHAEESSVFRMRQGEVWFLDATQLHSAANFSGERRLNLCLDFELGNLALSAIFQSESNADLPVRPDIIQRPRMTKEFENGIFALSEIVDEINYKTIIGLLSRIPFYKRASLAQFFDWLLAITRDSGNAGLYEKTLAFSHFLRVERDMSERFAL